MPQRRSLDELMEQTARARDAALAAWGEPEPDVLAPRINPSLDGGPRWPALRQAWQIVHRPDAALLASDGLADPFDEDDAPTDCNGFEVEVYGICREGAPDLAPWFLDLVHEASQTAAEWGDLRPLLEKVRFVSTELCVDIPPELEDKFVNAKGRVGALFGLTGAELPSSIEGPLSTIRLVNVKLLTLDELEFILEGGASARNDLAARFEQTPDALVSSLHRDSILERG